MLSVYATFLLHSMQFDQSENFFMDYVQGNLHVHVRLSEYTLNSSVMDDGEDDENA